MDQFVSCFGKAGHALCWIAGRSISNWFAVPEKVKFVICNTMVKHQNSGGEYNRRRAECEEGVLILSAFYPGIHALRDVTPEQLAAHADVLPPVIYKRCLHVVEENARVLETVESFRSGDLARRRQADARLPSQPARSLRSELP